MSTQFSPRAQIDALSEAITILYRANGSNCCGWAEKKIHRAASYLSQQQTLLCVIHFEENSVGWTPANQVMHLEVRDVQ